MTSTAASTATKKGVGALLKARRSGELENVVASLPPQAVPHTTAAASVPQGSEASSSQGNDDLTRAAAARAAVDAVPCAVPPATPALDALGALEVQGDEGQRLLVKAKMETQHIKHMRMKGEIAAADSDSPSAFDHSRPDCTSSIESVQNHTVSLNLLESRRAQHLAEQLSDMEQALQLERAASQSQIEQLQRQLQESVELQRASAEEHARLSKQHTESVQLISDLQKLVEDSNAARVRQQSETSDLVAGITSSLAARTQDAQDQVPAVSAGSDRQSQGAAAASAELRSLRSCLALASDHAQAAMRAKAQLAGSAREPVHRCLWESSCGWYLKQPSGEQQGPLDMAALSKIAPKQITSCWCEGFKKWVLYDRAMRVMRQGAGRDDDFDLVQYHVAQVCFLHSRASDLLESSLGLCCREAPSAAQSPESAVAESPLRPALQHEGYPNEVMEAMWLTVSKRSS
jgi:hypothetical protein